MRELTDAEYWDLRFEFPHERAPRGPAPPPNDGLPPHGPFYCTGCRQWLRSQRTYLRQHNDGRCDHIHDVPVPGPIGAENTPADPDPRHLQETLLRLSEAGRRR